MTPSERHLHNSKVQARYTARMAEIFVECFNSLEGKEARSGFYDHAERSAKYVYLHVGEDTDGKAFLR